MRVRNLNGTSDNACKCGSWLQHWKNFSGQRVNHCVVNGCINPATVGGHVQKADYRDNNWYIIPICAACNQRRGDIDIFDGTALVSANRGGTCGY
jgi:hypothetical protein